MTTNAGITNDQATRHAKIGQQVALLSLSTAAHKYWTTAQALGLLVFLASDYIMR